MEESILIDCFYDNDAISIYIKDIVSTKSKLDLFYVINQRSTFVFIMLLKRY